MKFSTSLTLAAITLMSTTGSTNARIGQHTCQNPATYISEIAQCTNAGNGYTCQNVRLGGTPVYRCVAPPTPAAPVSCQDPSTYNKTFTPQCINVGTGGYTCKNVRLGGDALYQCVAPPAPTAAPTSEIITD